MDAPRWPVDPDPTFCPRLVRELRTSELIRIVGDHTCLAEACDPDGELRRVMADRHAATVPAEARNRLSARAHELLPAAMAELDRRLPIPKEG